LVRRTGNLRPNPDLKLTSRVKTLDGSNFSKRNNSDDTDNNFNVLNCFARKHSRKLSNILCEISRQS
ncbi:hypothetical protein CHS0354_000045, partial [Potamilus streckersoni]